MTVCNQCGSKESTVPQTVDEEVVHKCESCGAVDDYTSYDEDDFLEDEVLDEADKSNTLNEEFE